MAKVKESNNDETRVTVNYEQCSDWYDVIINDELQLHISRNETGYSIDCYRYAEQTEMEDEDYDFDSDFITSCTVNDEDLIRGN